MQFSFLQPNFRCKKRDKSARTKRQLRKRDFIIIAFEYFNSHKVDPSFFEVSANVKDAERDYMQMHPTIDLKRYCPDWTVATYINELKKLFNLKVDSDDIKKEITLNFNETLTDTQTPHISNKSLKVNSFDASKHTSYP